MEEPGRSSVVKQNRDGKREMTHKERKLNIFFSSIIIADEPHLTN